jgi:hypothetical protein
MTHAAKQWLQLHSAGVPASLSEHMLRALAGAVSDDASASTSEALLLAAMSCLREAVELCDARHGALPLLAADGLMTAACEAAAQQGVSVLDSLCVRIAPHTLETMADAP